MSAEKEIARGKQEINKMIEQAKVDLQKQVGELAILLAEEIIARELTPTDHKNIIKKYVENWQIEVNAN